MAQVSISANIHRKNIIENIINLLTEEFGGKFNNFHIWKIAFFLSIKSNVSSEELNSYETENTAEQIKVNINTIIDDEKKYFFINLLSITHDRKIEIKPTIGF